MNKINSSKTLINKEIFELKEVIKIIEKNNFSKLNNFERLCRTSLKAIKNKKKIVRYLKKYGGYTGKKWLNNHNKVLFSPHMKKFKELYIPRAVFNFWM